MEPLTLRCVVWVSLCTLRPTTSQCMPALLQQLSREPAVRGVAAELVLARCRLHNRWAWVAMTPIKLLVQATQRPEGRTYAEYESVNECMEGICKMYEEHLKRMNPLCQSITYGVGQLFEFIDRMVNLSCLLFRDDTQTYKPYSRERIKERIYMLLSQQAPKART